MLFGDPATWNPTRWKPFYTQIIRLYWQGLEQVEVAKQLSCSADLVGKVVRSDHGREILKQLDDKTFDSMLDVITMAQAVSVEMFNEKVKLALYSNDEKIRTRNTTDLLAIAGHTPVHRVSIERPDPILEAYKNKTPEQLREALLKLKDASPTLENGPDGKPLN
jgi:hypothetical protein